MGRKSTRENKTIYQKLREENDLTREKAAELLEFISEDRLERIENEKSEPAPEDVIRMAEVYKAPELCNYYCSHECPIGRKYVPPIEMTELPAIILETVQGEGGIYPATKEFLQGVKKICEENDILLILDEIQCGMGRTGSMYAWQEYGVEPDIMTTAKALGCGVPVGAFVLNEKTANATLVPGDHGTTYGGNPFACAAVTKVFELFEKNHIVDHVNELTPYLEKRLDKLVEKYDFLSARRGKGFMQGLVVTGRPVGEILKKALENGLIVLSAGSDVIRLVPPLVIEKEHIDEMIEKLEKSF